MKALIHDSGLFSSFAEVLASSPLFTEVLYFTPVHDQFPVSKKALIGAGLEKVKRVYRFWDHVEEADLIAFPDVGLADLQVFLRDTLQKPVWGSAEAEYLELERVGLKRLLPKIGLLTADYSILDGMDELEEHLKDTSHEDEFIKISRFRGDLETYHHHDWFRSESWFRELKHRIGPMAEIMEFLSEEKIEGVEVGWDGYCVDGKFPSLAVLGYEAKDQAYIGQVMSQAEMPSKVTFINDRLSSTLAALKCRSAMSTELRITSRGQVYLIDPCERLGSPPSECLLSLFSNWPEIVWAGSQGNLVEPKPVARFAAELMLSSPWVEENWLPIRIPPSSRPFVKLYNHCIIGDTDWVVPTSIHQIGAAIGLGSTMKDACEQAKEIAESLDAHELTYDPAAFDRLEETIEKGEKEGIRWG